jgi:hypothetical protein
VIWLAALIAKTTRIADGTELSKLCVYTTVFAAVIIADLADRVVRRWDRFRLTSGRFALRFASLHSFVLLMVFMHWPYDYRVDEVYIAPEDEKDQTIHDLLDSQDQH